MNARHDALLALTASVPWPLRPQDAPTSPVAPLPPIEPAIEDPPSPDQRPPVQGPPVSTTG